MLRAVVVGLCWCLCLAAQAQKVGVVLSGGAAKGIAHVGVLKALEENEVPIDYIVGTSMGGIVAGCYAAGMSPAQIEELFLTEDFLNAVNGRLERGYNYYYNKPDERPSFLKLNLTLDSTFNINLNSSLANDLVLNFTLAEKLAQSASASNSNFDSLFVPLRVVAADVFTQSVVVLKSGALSDALRATQTVPFFYSPIRIDGKYLFDGGVYNNFPVDVVQKDFNPDMIIGSNVSSKVYDDYPYGNDEDIVSRSLLYMLLDKSDPAQVPATGVYIQPDLRNYSAFDFAKVRALIDSGYAQTQRQMAEIKSKLPASLRSCEEVAARRNAFNSKTKPIRVENIRYEGFSARQQRYLNKFFKNGRRPLFLSDVKSGYYRLVSDSYFHHIFPSFRYQQPGTYEFVLAKRPQNNFQVDFGGSITTRNISNIYLGLNYYYFNRALTHADINFYAGNFYKSAQTKARIDFANFGRFYVEPEATFSNWDFLQGEDLVVKTSPTVLRRIDRKIGAQVGIPVGRQYKLALGSYFINNSDRYSNSKVFVSTDTLDVLRLLGWRTGLHLSTNTLDRKQYASRGKAFQVSADWFAVHEISEPGSTAAIRTISDQHHTWLRARISLEEYFKRGIYSSGYVFEGVFSNQPFFSNYRGTVINAPGFQPLQDSRTLMLENFRAFNYIAGGWRNVFAIRKSLDFRLEGYLFKPIESIIEQNDQTAALTNELTRIHFMGSAALVLHSTVGPIGLSLNYYDDAENQLGILLHVGFLLFHKTSLE